MNWQQTSRLRACKNWEDAYIHVIVREEDLYNSYSQVVNTFGYITICSIKIGTMPTNILEKRI